MEYGFVLMNLSKHKRWRTNGDCKTAIKKETHPVCLHAAEMYEKMESVNTKNDYKTVSKK